MKKLGWEYLGRVMLIHLEDTELPQLPSSEPAETLWGQLSYW